MLLPFILILHAVVAALVPPLLPRLGSRVFLLAGVPPAVAALWALVHAPDAVAGKAVTASIAWVPALDITLDFRFDALALAMVTLVSGVGAVIFCYGAWYFNDNARGAGRLATFMTLFAGAMLGVVTTDNLFALYVFWELTSVTSFLLIGYDDQREGSRRAATQALVTTAGFGLLMLLGFLILGEIGGTYRITELLAAPPTHHPLLPVALVMVLAGALAKSAQVPLHYWLPNAMVAPTPVSAYLHAAAMVKGGVYLIARLAPGFADVAPWRGLVLTVGVATMLLGGWRALRENDLKLLLAYGTVSQLGFLTLLSGTGTHVAAVAAMAALLAHGLFKAALFLVVGIIDRQCGTREADRLSGLGRQRPALAVVAALAAASMAGIPLTLGFIGKEAALEALLTGHEAGMGTAAASAALLGVALASVLTCAYSVRFVWEAFADKATVPRRHCEAVPAHVLSAPAVLAVIGVGSGVAPAWVDGIAQRYALPLAATDAPYHLAAWHGITPALGLSGLILLGGLALFARRSRVHRIREALPRPPRAEAGYHLGLRAVYAGALAVTRRLQSGSLPVYLGVILATMLALPGLRLLTALLTGAIEPPGSDGIRLWDNALEPVVATVIVVTTIAVVRERRRFPALILASALGFGVAGLFVLHAAPDLALTLILVETLTTIILVFVLRRLPATFGVGRARWADRVAAAICLAAGAFIAGMLWLTTDARTHAPISREYATYVEEAGGGNLVNVILADFRALDTFGEVVVLVTAAVAVASLVLLNRRARVVDEPSEDTTPVGRSAEEVAPHSEHGR